MKSRRLAVLVLLGTLTSCATELVILEPIPCPLFPELITIDEEMEGATPPFVIAAVTENYMRLIEWGEKLEVRAGC